MFRLSQTTCSRRSGRLPSDLRWRRCASAWRPAPGWRPASRLQTSSGKCVAHCHDRRYASALAEVLLHKQTADALVARLFTSGLALHVPHLLDVEIVHVIRRHAAGGHISPDRGYELLTDLLNLSLQRHPHDWLLPRVWELRHDP